MPRRLNDFQGSIIFGLIFLILPAPNAVMALTVEKLTFEDIVRDAETIAIGVVEQAEAAYGEGKRKSRIFTSYRFSLSQVLNGDIEVDKPLQISIIGGRVGDIIQHYPGVPVLKIGVKYLIFVTGNEVNAIPFVGATQGISSIVKKASGVEYVVPMRGAHLIDRDTLSESNKEVKLQTKSDVEIPLEDFIERIKAVLR